MVRLGDDHRGGQHRRRVGERHMKALDHRRQHQAGLGQCQLRADADPRAGAEWHIRKTVRQRGVAQEPGRIEHLAQKVDDLMSSIAVRAGNIDATRAAVLACLHLADELESLERRLASLKDNVDHKARKFTILLDEAMSGVSAAD